jgi:hypothetical protein
MNEIQQLLEKYDLTHYKYYEEPSRLVYTHESGTSLHIYDYKRLIELLKNNNIKHSDIGADVILLDEE